MRTFLLRGTAVAVVALALARSALAFEPTGNATADAFLGLIEAGKARVASVGAVSGHGDQIEIREIVLDGTDEPGTSAEIAKVVITGGEVLADGRLKMAALALDDVTLDADDTEVSFTAFRATDLVLPSAAEIAAGGGEPVVGPSYRTIETFGVTVITEDGNEVALDKLFVAVDAMDGDLPTAGRLALSGLLVEAENLDEDGKKSLTDLGYDSLTLDVDAAFAWDPQTGVLDLSRLDLSGAEVGALALKVQLAGLTREVVTRLNESREDSDQALALLQGVSVAGLSIRFDNDSVVERLLDSQAKEAGVDRDTFVAQLQAGLPMLLTILQNQAFQDMVMRAVTTFLQDPVSLHAEAKPAAPVTVAQIMGTAMMAPQSLPQVLGVSVSANGN
ncbi:hypothetical protein [Polymorphum gilvum]|uniref:DUF2125 domain-containing protein n=1 Tax=Polymorphum gilvum (strain LMG 25793 / CGMCC 1.9160 / SL003B-26A1) TaxID=991905 RepID=F2J1J7_POLGS|nr:hypothetical protein [Polymorphum gilvum]ADZ70798.1 hypothetical protein SL003B_2373 [Polymorphum gilvum SL003B-26A1]